MKKLIYSLEPSVQVEEISRNVPLNYQLSEMLRFLADSKNSMKELGPMTDSDVDAFV